MSKLRSLFSLAQGFRLFAAFCIGRVPNHRLRLCAYRRMFGMHIASGATVHWRTVFFAPEGIKIGRGSIVGNDCFLDGRRGISIGSNVNIGAHVDIYTLEHEPNSTDFGVKGGPVTIGDRAYVASRVTILPEVTLGEGSVVAAGAVVTRDVDPYVIVGGVPARPIGKRQRDLTYQFSFHMPFQ